MSNNLTQFVFPADGESYEVRVVGDAENPMWVAADVCRILDIDTSVAVNGRKDRPDSGLDDDEKGTVTVSTLGGEQEMLCVNESGLYNLILGSRKPQAKIFKRWITHEVLPAIRKTGSYSIKSQPKTMLQMHVELATEMLKQEQHLLALEEEQKLLASQQQAQQEDIAVIAQVQEIQQEIIEDVVQKVDAQQALLAEQQARLAQMDEIRAAADEFLRETTGDRPDGNVPPLTDRARVSRVVRRYCQVYGVPFKDAWRRLKMEFRDRYHIDLAARARNYNVGGKKQVEYMVLVARRKT
jgi:prophage antirepressor-like protein